MYDYSKADYNNARSELTIICPYHGPFQQIADKHLQGHGCQKCATIRKNLLIHCGLPNERAMIYLTRLDAGQPLIKIGWSVNSFNQRYTAYLREQFWDEFHHRALDVLKKAQELETEILQRFTHYQRIPKCKFIGKTECFDVRALLEISEYIDDYFDPMAGVVDDYSQWELCTSAASRVFVSADYSL